LYNYKLAGLPFAQSPPWVQVPQLSVTNIDFVASAWSPPGAGGNALPTCVMVGYNDNFGGIVRSTNGGGFWSTVVPGINTGLSTRLADVAAAPAGVPGSGTGTFVAVALSGDIYVSSNNGVSFVNQGAAAAALYGVAIGTNGIAYAVGLTSTLPYTARIYRSYAFTSFSSWTDISANAPASTSLLTAVSSKDGRTVIAVGTGGTVLYSSNNGTSWALSAAVPTTNTLQCVSAASANVAMAAGNAGTLLLTKNGGQSWVDVTGGYSAAVSAAVGASPSFLYHAISMVSPTAAYAATSAGAVIRTLNQGTFLPPPPAPRLFHKFAPLSTPRACVPVARPSSYFHAPHVTFFVVFHFVRTLHQKGPPGPWTTSFRRVPTGPRPSSASPWPTDTRASWVFPAGGACWPGPWRRPRGSPPCSRRRNRATTPRRGPPRIRPVTTSRAGSRPVASRGTPSPPPPPRTPSSVSPGRRTG
jgi:photosystem II stability/assembly factor-like uncharacterized protein